MNTTPRVADSEGGHTPRRQGRAGASPGPAADPTAGREKQIDMELKLDSSLSSMPGCHVCESEPARVGGPRAATRKGRQT